MLKQQFASEPFFRKLQKRAATFALMMDHLEKMYHRESLATDMKTQPFWIIETGCTRIRDNWGGDGQSTRIWDWVIGKFPGVRALSIDITPEYIELSKELAPQVNFRCADSLKALSELHVGILNQCALLYLDSYDWSPELHMDSSFHHVCELAMVYKSLPSGCMIVVDDRHSQSQGKHFMVQMFFEKLGIQPVFVDYQIGWIKP